MKPEQVAVNDDHCFVGFDAYKKLIFSGVDVVLIACPPHFHPLHLKAAIDAGKHVFCEKPHGVDVPGVKMSKGRHAKRPEGRTSASFRAYAGDPIRAYARR